MTEREERGGVEAADAGALRRAERRLQVGTRLPAGSVRDLHRKLAAGLDPTGEHPGDRRAALLAWHERLDQRGGSAVETSQRVRTAGHHAPRRPASRSRGPPRAGSAWTPGSRRSTASQPSPDVPRPNSPARSPTNADAQVGAASAASTAAAKPDRFVPARHRSPARGRRPRRPSRRASSLRSASTAEATVDAEALLRVPGHDVVREGVAAHEGARSSAHGPDDGDPTQRGPAGAEQRQRRPRVEQDDRALRQLTGERPVRRGVQVDPGRRGDRSLGSPVRVEQAELDLLAQVAAGPPDRGVPRRARRGAPARRDAGRSRGCRAARRRCRQQVPARPPPRRRLRLGASRRGTGWPSSRRRQFR